jgi:hypothetical protein
MIFFQLSEQLESLKNLLHLLSNEQYCFKNIFLGNASIGGHSRHIIELLKCATEGYDSGTVDYLNRVRNLELEANRDKAIQELGSLQEQIRKSNREMKLIVEGDHIDLPNNVDTTYYREIVYNTEHTIHHLALIRVALREMQLDIVDEDFGVAHSTIKYRMSKS